ncbi:hypothetical protein L1049_011721 [Liquidambar formosana]|uniref:Transmembrane protein n=1 Tax=Liquidambar formosana TaxID=63359 RepID=A0AAP0RYS8_LIQFO
MGGCGGSDGWVMIWLAVLEGAVIVVVNGDEYWMVVVVIMNKKHGCGRVAVGDGDSGDRVGGMDGAMAVL